MRKSLDFVLQYIGYSPDFPGKCRVRVYQPTNKDTELRSVVVVTQTPQPVGFTISLFIEEIAGRVAEMLREKGCVRGPVQAETLEWVGHYPFRMEGDDRFGVPGHDPCLSSIKFGSVGQGRQFYDPSWSPLSLSQVRELLNSDLASQC